MSLILALIVSASAHAYQVGNAPFCVMDNFGNTECYYYDLGSCQEAAKMKIGPAACVRK